MSHLTAYVGQIWACKVVFPAFRGYLLAKFFCPQCQPMVALIISVADDMTNDLWRAAFGLEVLFPAFWERFGPKIFLHSAPIRGGTPL